jgi:nucleoside-diphosphate-sugar epimerase
MTAAVAVLGATGVFGRHLVPRLVAAGHQVRALVRRPEAAGAARACGAEARIADIFDADSLRAGLEGCGTCINLATSLPGPSGRGDFDANDRLRRDGTPLLLEACAQAGIARLLQQSICWVGAAGDRLADEDSLYRPEADDIAGRAILAALAMEGAVAASALDWLILRGGLFYGPGTGFDDDWFARAASGKLRLPGDGSAYVSLVHIADMAAATVAALETWPSRRRLIVADDSPARWRDVFGHVAILAGAPPPEPGGRAGFPSFRMSNARARLLLRWVPRYPDYRAGLAR